jgi:hypothetical protein
MLDEKARIRESPHGINNRGVTIRFDNIVLLVTSANIGPSKGKKKRCA